MNRKLLSAAVLALSAAAAGNALADDITIDTTPFVSTKSRAEVMAELQQYQKAGVNPWSTSYNPLKSFRSARSADEVRAEAVAALRSGEIDALYGEDSGAAYLKQAAGNQAYRSATLAGTPANAH